MNADSEYREMREFGDTLRVPPHSTESEQAVLGGLMLDPDALPRVADWLKADDFYRADHRWLFMAIVGLRERKSPCDAITLGEWFEANGLSDAVDRVYLLELASTTPSAANIVAYAEIVVERARLRQTLDVATRMLEACWRPGASSEAIIGHAAHELAAIQVSRLRGGLTPIKPAMSRLFDQMQGRYEEAEKAGKDARPLLGMPWPWRDMNRVTKGLRDGVLYVVGARPNMGKTVFGLQAAIFNALRGEHVAVFSVEMSTDECMARAVAATGMIPHDWVDNPTPYDDDAETHWSRLSDAAGQLIGSTLLVDDTPSITIDQLMARARRAHRQKPIRLIVVDHIHDMGVDEKRELRREYGRIVQGAKTLAKELNCPVILMAQLNRLAGQRKDPRPVMSDLRESGEIEQKADVILFLHRDDYYDKNSKRRGIVDVILAKGRNIKTGENVELVNCFEQMRLKDNEGWGHDYTEDDPRSIDRYVPKSIRR
ncbi:replicative DNA helicase [Luteibacter sp. PPL201]|uniref:DNA 5'-3' helicase n=1 Tax=Luteibacter sahnii TaxID=3021977 RepID=A0ABT6B7P3_9GAMM